MHSKVCLSPLTVQLHHKTVTNSISTFNILWKHILAVRVSTLLPPTNKLPVQIPSSDQILSIHSQLLLCCVVELSHLSIWFGFDLV